MKLRNPIGHESNRGVQARRPAIPVGATTPTEPFSKPEITLKRNRAANSEAHGHYSYSLSLTLSS
jgi:hypothetical protein